MNQLRGEGMHLIAHGEQSIPKRIWIKLKEDIFSLLWQVEHSKRIQNKFGGKSTIIKKGRVHKVTFQNILYIDVGKKTSALLKPENESTTNSCCFSLLAQSGSLDLEANSIMERDALVACFRFILDQVHDV